MNRRLFLKNGLLTGVALATGSCLYGCTDLEFDNTDLINDEVTVVLSALIPVFLNGVLPEQVQARQAKISQVIEAIRIMLAKFPPHMHKELKDLFGLLDNRLTMLAFVGHYAPLQALSSTQIIRLIDAWRNSFLHLLNTAYEGLKELIYAAFYGDPANWAGFNYQKPQLGV